MIRDIQDEIMRLKKENDVCILAHLYQNDAILEVADYTGDSFALAKLAQTVPNKTVLMCGVRFMAGDSEDAGAGQAGTAEQSGRRLPYGGADGPGSDPTGERELPGLYRGGVYQHYGGA